ncbi:hypothetical protein DPMN_084383 [Dreissena polymorpha]|uniref:Uncharacterized protein n=1 Tax=Dreissena polymorpha TaxID=45954 RepID=A0A9D3YE77_DREPO|nr:hypothetical protein DPMN_084383 [Dreissena polymorpha]
MRYSDLSHHREQYLAQSSTPICLITGAGLRDRSSAQTLARFYEGSAVAHSEYLPILCSQAGATERRSQYI